MEIFIKLAVTIKYMNHEKFMREALKEAELGDAPFGAVIVSPDGKIVSRGYDNVDSSNDPTAHAELTAIRTLCKKNKSRNFQGYYCYSTSEPCAMCMAACLKAKINNFYYGISMEKSANLYIRAKYTASKFRKFKVNLKGGILEKECLAQRLKKGGDK
jgi:tRNA(adenine34) deaminase